MGNSSAPPPSNQAFDPICGCADRDAFADTSSGLKTNAMTSITQPTLLAFFNPSLNSLDGGGYNNSIFSLLSHEALHGYGATIPGSDFNDAGIQEAFYGRGSPKVGRASDNINRYISQYCFH
jgi:hypothetical protein